MVSPLFFYELGLIALVWLFLMLCWLGPNATVRRQPIAPSQPSRRKRSTAPKAFAGLTHKPHCALCEQDTSSPPAPPPLPPAPMTPTHRRPRKVDTSMHFCPHGHCDYQGWRGLGNLRANGLPTICQAEFVTFFAPSALRAHNESGLHHNTYDDAAWPSGYAGVGRQ